MNSRNKQVKEMVENVHILVATPSIYWIFFLIGIGRFVDTMRHFGVSLSNLLFFILDEADQYFYIFLLLP